MNEFAKLLGSWHGQNVIAIVVVVFLVWLVRHQSKQPFWRLAFLQVFERKMVRVSFGVLCVYAAVALMDSVGYYPVVRDQDGVPRKNQQGEVVRDANGISLLDWVTTPLRTAREKTYSAPFATHQFTKEMIQQEDGSVVRTRPPLNHPRRHILGTDRVGNDVFLQSLKSVRTGMVIGAFTTMLVIPFAILFGVTAGYFGGWVDDLIQYFYTVLSSIPSVLLIVAFMMVLDAKLPEISRLTALCIIMGITSWTGLCRVLRGETLKLREMEYVQAAEATGLPRIRIILGHIVPNLMHLVLITVVLGFSGRVLAEAVLTYIGIGVGTDTMSWGNMINNARLELAQSPMVWWNLVAAFIFMLGLVLPANLFGDAVRDALDPKLRTQ